MSQLKLDRRIGGGMGFTCIDLVSLRFTWSHLVPHGLAWSHFDSLGLIWFHVASLGLTLTFSVSFEPTWSHLVLLGLTWLRLVSRGLTWFHWVSLGLAWSHLDSLGFPGFPRAQERNPCRQKGKGKTPSGNLEPVPTLHPERAHARTNGNRNRFPGWTHPPTSDVCGV